VYLKFLTAQRGKGLFYLGVGILVLFMKPNSEQMSGWGINNVAALVLAIVGSFHGFKIIREEEAHLGPGAADPAAGLRPAGDCDFSAPLAVGSSRPHHSVGSEWGNMVSSGSTIN
jgi:hypothetical protein